MATHATCLYTAMTGRYVYDFSKTRALLRLERTMNLFGGRGGRGRGGEGGEGGGRGREGGR